MSLILATIWSISLSGLTNAATLHTFITDQPSEIRSCMMIRWRSRVDWVLMNCTSSVSTASAKGLSLSPTTNGMRIPRSNP